jgi:hypothetical protein
VVQALLYIIKLPSVLYVLAIGSLVACSIIIYVLLSSARPQERHHVYQNEDHVVFSRPKQHQIGAKASSETGLFYFDLLLHGIFHASFSAEDLSMFFEKMIREYNPSGTTWIGRVCLRHMFLV